MNKAEKGIPLQKQKSVQLKVPGLGVYRQIPKLLGSGYGSFMILGQVWNIATLARYEP